MRQNFILKNKLPGNGNIKLLIETNTDLDVNVKEQELEFAGNSGDIKMTYSSLKCWDANGKVLNAHFTSNFNIESGNVNEKSFCISVNDNDAVYPVTIDPLSISPNWITESNQETAAYGHAVSTAGDVNGDGYSDVIIGAPFFDAGIKDEGKVFVFYGSAVGVIPVATWSAEGNQMNSQLGWAVSSAGDVNNDGYSDVIVGANIYNNGEIDEGRIFVYHGSALGLSLTPNFVAESNQESSQYGWSVSSAGDINQDGFSDIVVGAPMFDNGQLDEGRTFVYRGSASGLTSQNIWTSESNQVSAFYGYSVSGAGDINNDGYSDVIVGAITFDSPLRDEGGAFAYYGSASGLTASYSWRAPSNNAFFANFGISVASAGDVNGDGFDDVIVGAYTYDNVETDEGRVFLYYGTSGGISTTANWIMEINQPYARFGCAVSSAGDVNADGYSDVIIGAREYDNGQTDEGKVFVYTGSSSGLSLTPSWSAESNQATARFGNSVSSAGKVNNDNFSDVIVGSYLYNNGQPVEGRAFIYHGGAQSVKILNLTTFVEGLYNSSTSSMVADTVSVVLRTSTSPYTLVDQSKTKMSNSGTGTLSFANASNGVNYYLALKHRNSIETWSASVRSFSNSQLSYDFSTSSSQAYGNNMKQIDASPIRFGIYSGDASQDGAVDLTDVILIFNNSNSFVTGYVATDINGDLITDLTDLIIGFNNSQNFIFKITP